MTHETSWHKDKAAFDDLCKLWDKAQEDGIFDKASGGNNAPERRSDFFGQYTFPDEAPLSDSEISNWSSVISRSGELVPDESMMLMEAAKAKATKKAAEKKGEKASDFKPVKTTLEKATGENRKNLKDKVKALANLPQRVDSSTFGNDSQTPGGPKESGVKVTAGLAAFPNFEALVNLKKEIELAEIEMSNRNGLNEKKITQLEKKFADLRRELEKLSKSAGDYETNQYFS